MRLRNEIPLDFLFFLCSHLHAFFFFVKRDLNDRDCWCNINSKIVGLHSFSVAPRHAFYLQEKFKFFWSSLNRSPDKSIRIKSSSQNFTQNEWIHTNLHFRLNISLDRKQKFAWYACRRWIFAIERAIAIHLLRFWQTKGMLSNQKYKNFMQWHAFFVDLRQSPYA